MGRPVSSAAAIVVCLMAVGADLHGARAGEARPADCAPLRSPIERALDVEAGLRFDPDAALQPANVAGQTGRACRLSLTATGETLESPRTPEFSALADAIRGALAAAGWREGERTLRFDADGPNGTAFGLQKADDVCVVRVNVDGLVGGRCPPDAPADLYDKTCGFQPWERRYRIEALCFRPGD